MAPKVSYRWLLIVGGKNSISKLCNVGRKYSQKELKSILNRRTEQEKGREITKEPGFIQETPVIPQDRGKDVASMDRKEELTI